MSLLEQFQSNSSYLHYFVSLTCFRTIKVQIYEQNYLSPFYPQVTSMQKFKSGIFYILFLNNKVPFCTVRLIKVQSFKNPARNLLCQNLNVVGANDSSIT